ncbi:MAG: hypothetical protein ACLQBX_19530 [Candidatus Limnocylindrales bacterium]
MYFYELHESDDDLFSDALLTHEEEFTPDEFFEFVQEARRRVQDTFEEDTLVEAVAHELERTLEFTYVSDALLEAAVNVSRIEDENYLAAVDEGESETDAQGDGDDDDLDGTSGGFRTVIVDLERERQN